MSQINGSKVSERLAYEAANKEPTEEIDVVIALSRPDDSSDEFSMSREHRIAARKSAFEARAESLAKHVSSVGGVVTATAWINSTVRGRVPVASLDEVAQDDMVEVIDLQPPLQLDDATVASVSETRNG